MAGHIIGYAALLGRPGFHLQIVDQINDIEETPPQASPDAGACNGDSQMGLARTRATNQHSVALIGNESARGEILDQSLVDWCAIKGEVVNVLGQWEFGDLELITDGAGLFLDNLRLKQIAHNVRRLMLAFDPDGFNLLKICKSISLLTFPLSKK